MFSKKHASLKYIVAGKFDKKTKQKTSKKWPKLAHFVELLQF